MGATGSQRTTCGVSGCKSTMIHLDTSFLIRALVPGSPQDKSLRRWLESGDSFVMSTIAWAEFLCGPLETRQADLARQIVSDRIAFSEEDAIVGARLFNDAGRRRGSMFDCMIAATALRFGSVLATANVEDFRRFSSAGLELFEA